MENLLFYSEPNNKIILSATSTKIMKFHHKYINESENEKNLSSSYSLLFEINLRECIIGEIYIQNSYT